MPQAYNFTFPVTMRPKGLTDQTLVFSVSLHCDKTCITVFWGGRHQPVAINYLRVSAMYGRVINVMGIK